MQRLILPACMPGKYLKRIIILTEVHRDNKVVVNIINLQLAITTILNTTGSVLSLKLSIFKLLKDLKWETG